MAKLSDRSPTTHSGAVGAGAAVPPPHTVCWAQLGLGEVAEKYFLDGISANRPRLAPVLLLPGECRGWGGGWEAAGAAAAPCRGPWELRSGTARPRTGTQPWQRGATAGPCTTPAVTPTRSHISHTNCSLHRVLIQFVAVSITTSQRFLVLSVAVGMPRSDVSGMLRPGTRPLG